VNKWLVFSETHGFGNYFTWITHRLLTNPTGNIWKQVGGKWNEFSKFIDEWKDEPPRYIQKWWLTPDEYQKRGWWVSGVHHSEVRLMAALEDHGMFCQNVEQRKNCWLLDIHPQIAQYGDAWNSTDATLQRYLSYYKLLTPQARFFWKAPHFGSNHYY